MSRSFPLISKDKVGVIDASVDRATSPSDLSRQEPSSRSGVDLPKHTPGPWREGIDGNLRVYGPDNMGEHTGLIATVYKGRANVRLIAAAPDLLDALQRIVDSGVALTQTQRIDARDAIAKARGVS